MKIESIKVENVRGLVDFYFEPKGKNVVVCGPNGSGKSALVDAIEFLLTGKISRLAGKGTGELSLKDHGPHVDHEPKEAIVSAEISLQQNQRNFVLERKMSQPNKLICTPEPDEEAQSILKIASTGYHTLSRREILRFIAAEPGARASQIQELLKLAQVEELRKLLSSSIRELENLEKNRGSDLNTQKNDIVENLDVPQFSMDLVLASINSKREILDATPITAEQLKQPKIGTQAPTSTIPALNRDLIEKDLMQVNLGREKINSIANEEKQLRDYLLKIKEDPELKKALDRKQLLDLGESLLDDAAECPLCGKPWEPEELRQHLRDMIEKATEAGKIQAKVRALAQNITKHLRAVIAIIPRLTPVADALGQKDTSRNLYEEESTCKSWIESLSSPLLTYPVASGESATQQCLDNRKLQASLKALGEQVNEKVAKPSPQQNAWDVLTRFESQWQALKRMSSQLDQLKKAKSRCSSLLSAFEKSRDDVLGKLYSKIETRFTDLYKRLHDHETPNFAAEIRPEGAGVKFEVDFHGRGKFPPLAVHSEGHQDSMGLCLYLALIDEVEAPVSITILDDVVMSVDSNHRRPVCRLLLEKFPGRQFFVTTHDKLWARQLRNSGLVPPENFINFRSWTVEAGPKWNEASHWLEIEQLNRDGKVREASASLRRELEEFFDDACDSLAATGVPYSGEAQYDLGDLAHGAISQLGDLLKRAKAATHSWGQKDRMTQLQQAEDAFTKAKQISNVEGWLVNVNIHFTKWADATPKDFEPVINGFLQLKLCFECQQCKSLLHISPRKSPEALRCTCGNVNWNLTNKKDKEK